MRYLMVLLHDKAFHVSVEGEFTEISPSDGKEFRLEEAQRMVDGLIEIVYLNNRQIMIINEEGKFSKKYNPFATAIAQLYQALWKDDYICGDVVICPSEMLP